MFLKAVLKLLQELSYTLPLTICISKTPLKEKRKHYTSVYYVTYLDYLSGLHGERGEVPTSVDRHALPENRVQSLHLLP